MRRLCAYICLLLAVTVARASAAEPIHVSARLLSDVSAVKPGDTFTVGIVLDIDPGWHVYWTNPGDAGLATSVKFGFPPGFTVGPNQFPTPRRFAQPGDEVAFGYEKQVVISARVTAPRDAPTGQVDWSASVRWLCCKAVCIRGSASLRGALAIADRTTPAQRADIDLLREWVARVPVEAATSGDVVEATVKEADASGLRVIEITWKRRPLEVGFFPGADDAVAVKDVRVAQQDNRTRITFALEVLKGQTPAAPALPVVVGYEAEGVGWRGIVQRVPLGAPEQKSENQRF